MRIVVYFGIFSNLTSIHQLFPVPLPRFLNTSFLPALVCGISLVLPLSAAAEEKYEDNTGWYGTLKVGGTSLLDGPDFDWTVDDQSFNGDLGSPWGFSAEGGAGYDWGAWRAELTYKYRWFNNNDLSFDSGNNRFGTLLGSSVGSSSFQSLLARLNYDFESDSSNLTPTIGAQLGVVCVTTPDVKITVNDPAGRYKVKQSGSQGCGLGWGGNAGFLYKISERLNGLVDVAYVQGAFSVKTGSKKVTRTLTLKNESYTLRDFIGNRTIAGSTCDARKAAGLSLVSCFDETIVPEETYTRDIEIMDGGMTYTPYNGLNVMVGLQYFFGRKNKPQQVEEVVVEEVQEEVVVEEEYIPEPVFEAEPKTPQQNSPIRALW